MKLAHQNHMTTEAGADGKGASGDSVYFRWNHKDVSQFSLVDAWLKGWTFKFVSATDFESEHILISAPREWSGSPGECALVVRTDMPSPDYEILAVHTPVVDVENSAVAAACGPLARYVDRDNFVSCHYKLTSGDSRSCSWCVSYKEAGWHWSSQTIPHAQAYESVVDVIQSYMYAKKGICGGGPGCPVVNSLMTVSDVALICDKTVGFGCYWVDGPSGGGERIKLYDFTVRKAE